MVDWWGGGGVRHACQVGIVQRGYDCGRDMLVCGGWVELGRVHLSLGPLAGVPMSPVDFKKCQL